MITIRPSKDRGHANHGWLDTYHTFSFAGYYDPKHMGFGPLRVINQDRVIGGAGFGTHGHRDMEIISYVLDGELQHEDSMGNASAMRPGDVQVLSAGRGITHSEFNGSPHDALHFLQMWVVPAEQGTTPRYDQKHFPLEERKGALRLVVSPDGQDGSLTINQDVRLYAGVLEAGDAVEHALAPGRRAWLHVARGTVRLNDVELGPGDGAKILEETALQLQGVETAEFVLFDLP